MSKTFKVLLICVLAVTGFAFISCKHNDEPKNEQLAGKWNCTKVVYGENTRTEELEYIFIEFKADGTCNFNFEGLSPTDIVSATYVYADSKITLSSVDENLVMIVKTLTATELVLDLPPMEADETSSTFYFAKQ
jgi:hypothetical protein